jgi:hypothetical protein
VIHTEDRELRETGSYTKILVFRLLPKRIQVDDRKLLPVEVSAQIPNGDFGTRFGSLIASISILIHVMGDGRNCLMPVIVNVDEAYHALADRHSSVSVGVAL